jgi:hypothetical protein
MHEERREENGSHENQEIVTSPDLSESIQNKVTIRGGKSKAKS